MKSLPVVLWLFYCSGIGFAQNSPGHAVVKNAKEQLSNAPAAPSTLEGMFQSVRVSTTNAQRADVYYYISRYYADRLKIDSALYYCEKIQEESRVVNYEKGIAKFYLGKCIALYFRAKTDIPALEKAAEIFTRQRDDLFLGYTFKELAREYERLDDFAQSRTNYYTAISFFHKAGEVRELQRVYYELGVGFYQTYEIDSAAYYLFTALQLAEKLNDTGRIFNSSGMLGEVYMASGDLEQGAKYLKYALDTRTPTTSRVTVRNRLSSYAECLLEQKQFQKAEEIINEYEAINQKLGDNWGMVNLNKIKGCYHLHRENYPEALKYLQAAYDRVNEIKSFSFDIKNIINYLGRTEYALGYYDSAIVHFGYVKRLATELKFGADLLDASLLISRSWEKKGNMDSAYHYFRVYDHLKDSMVTFQKEKAIIELTTKYETGKKEQEIELLQRERELDAYQLRSKMNEIENQNLLNAQKSQQLALLSQQNEINRLAASEKTLAFENQQKEMTKKQNELALSEKEKKLQVTLAAKQTQRKNFAYIAIVGVLLFSGYVFYRYTRNRKLSRRLTNSLAGLKDAQEQLIKMEKEKEAENIRVRISRDIHDEVGATLSGVALFSEIARQKMKQHKEDDAQVYLDHITANSKEMVEKMSDIVWTINPRNDSFDRIVDKLQSYAVNLCAGKGIRLTLNIDDVIRGYNPSMQVKRNIHMFVKEAINNAVKYSEGRNIFLSVHKTNDVMTVEVRDDGKGFDTNEDHKGNGLHNLQARANDLGGQFTIESGKDKGTCIRLQFHFHPAGGQAAAV